MDVLKVPLAIGGKVESQAVCLELGGRAHLWDPKLTRPKETSYARLAFSSGPRAEQEGGVRTVSKSCPAGERCSSMIFKCSGCRIRLHS